MELLKEKYSFSTLSQVINFLIQQAMENQEEKIAKTVIREFDQNYMSKERMKWALQTAEQNTIVLLDVANTLLFKEDKMSCITTDFATNSVIAESREHLKEKIAHFKQKSDDRKAKGK